MAIYTVYAKFRNAEHWVWFLTTGKPRLAAGRAKQLFESYSTAADRCDTVAVWKLRQLPKTFYPITRELEAVGKIIGAYYFDDEPKEECKT